MKKRRLVIVFITSLALCLSGCDLSNFPFDFGGASSSNSTSSTSESLISSGEQTSASVSSVSSDLASSSSSSSSSQLTPNYVPLEIFAFNDVHGNVKDTDGKGLGIAKTTTLLKELSKDKNSIFISQGDMWQGSVESNYTRGNLVTEWMNSLSFVSMTVGNHEFDWGPEVISANIQIASFPTLGINVINRSTNQRVDYLEPSVTFTRGEAKIGVIGAIGNCLSSISSSKVKGISFAYGNSLNRLVKQEAIRLRNEEHCDFIIYSLHGATYATSSDDKIDQYDVSLSSGHYVDLVLEGHTHKQYAYLDNGGVYHLQCHGYNQDFYKVSVNLDIANKKVEIDEPVSYDTSYATSPYKNYLEDEATNALFAKYYDNYAFAYENIGTISSSKSSVELRRKIAELYYQEGVAKWGDQYDIILGGGYLTSRGLTLKAGTVNYSDLANLFPFDNDIVLCASTGAQLKRTQFVSGGSNYYINWADDKSADYNWDNNTTYYLVTDTYSSDYYTNPDYPPDELEVIDVLEPNRYARDLLADYIAAGNWCD